MYFCVVPVSFISRTFDEYEHLGPLCLTLVLTMPAPFDATIEIFDERGTARGKLNTKFQTKVFAI